MNSLAFSNQQPNQTSNSSFDWNFGWNDPQQNSYMQTYQDAPDTDSTGTNWGGVMKGFGGVMSGLSSLAGAWNAYQQLGLIKDQYKTAIKDRNQNIKNQAITTNLGLANQARMAAQMMGHAPGTEGYNQYIRDNERQVDGSAIG